MNLSKVRTTIVPLISVSLLGAVLSQSPFATSDNPLEKRSPIELSLKDRDQIIRFKVPAEYLRDGDNRPGIAQEVIWLMAVYPSMMGAAKYLDKKYWDFVIFVTIWSRGYDYKKIIAWRKETDWVKVETLPGFDVYVGYSDVEKRKNPQAMIKEFLVPTDKDDVFIGCLREPGNPAAGCTAEFGYADNFSLKVTFPEAWFGELDRS